MACTGVRDDMNQLIERMFTMVQQQLPTGFRDDIGIVAERKDDVSNMYSVFVEIVNTQRSLRLS